MDLVLPQSGSYRSAGGRAVSFPKAEVLSLTIKGAESKPPSPVEEDTEALTGPETSKHPRRFQALMAAGPAKIVNRFTRRERTAEPAAAQ